MFYFKDFFNIRFSNARMIQLQYRELGLAVGGSLAGAQTRVLLSLQPSTENFVPMFAPLKRVYHDKSMTFYQIRCFFRPQQLSANSFPPSVKELQIFQIAPLSM